MSGVMKSIPLSIRRRSVELASVDRRKEYMMLLIVLSRIDVDACGPFLEKVPAVALHSPDHQWWGTEEREDLLEAMAKTIDTLKNV